MSVRALAPSPVARRLFELAERRADGTLEVGGRVVALRKGRIVDVGAAESDESLMEFMVRAGRIDAGLAEEATRRMKQKSLTAAQALAAVGVKAAGLASARRALFLDRLVRGLADSERADVALAPFEPDATHSGNDEGEELAPLVLDALERRAGEHDAGRVGERANELVHFVEGPFAELARRYVQQTDPNVAPAVFEIFRRSPASASRIAALVRAGLVLLQPEQHGAPPPRRPKSLAPPPALASVPPRAPTASTSGDGPRFRDTLRPGAPAAREPVMRLGPGTAGLELHDFPPAWELPEIPGDVGPLSDPLDAPERAIAQLEQAEAPGPERASAWLQFARAWLRHCASIDEAARCAREAAAADPSNLSALRESTHLCAAMGRIDLARAYARAAVHYATDEEAKSDGLLDLARFAEREGDIDAAIATLEEAAKFPSSSTEAWQRLSQLAYSRSDVDRAVGAAVGAARASLAERPDVARAWAESAQMLASDAEAASVEAHAVERLGRPLVASAILAARARAPFDAPTRQRLLLEAADYAERAGRYDVAFVRALEAHLTEPTNEALYELVADCAERTLERSAPALLEHLATLASPASRAAWLSRAADAFERQPGSGPWALELRARALLADPGSDHVVADLRAHAERMRDPGAFADAMERLVVTRPPADLAVLGRRLLELADYAENVLGSAPRALHALERMVEAHPGFDARARMERLRPRVRVMQNLADVAESDFAAASPDEKTTEARKLAAAIRDLPDRRARAIDLHRHMVADDPADDAAALGLERLLALTGADEELRLLHATRAEDEHRGTDGRRRHQHWAGLAALAGEREDAVSAAEAWLADEPDSPEAALRIDLAARVDGNLERRRAALLARLGCSKRDTERAALLVDLALLERVAGDVASTITLADQARQLDDDCADAWVVLLEELPRLEPTTAQRLLDGARVVLGDTPQLLMVAADLAATSGDDAARKRYVDARCAIAQDPPAVAHLRIERAIEDGNENDILAAAQEAISRGAIVAATPQVVERALEALAQFDPGDAATVAIHASDKLGESRFAELALKYAEASGLTERKVAALERWVAWSSGGARCVHLRTLAAVHRDAGARASESRTWLRLLSEDPGADDALERLSELYAETRDTERLSAVLALRLEAAEGPDARRDCLLHLAAASLHVLDDVERAEAFFRRIVAESEAPEAAVARAAATLVDADLPERAIAWLEAYAEQAADEPAERLLTHAAHVAENVMRDRERTLALTATALERLPRSTSLLLAFERSALALRAIDEAKRVYAIVEAGVMGEHGARGVVYRRARFLERAGDKPGALAAYLDAFVRSPAEGVVYAAIERLSSELGRTEDMVTAMQLLVSRTTQAERRFALLRDITSLLEHSLRDPGRAFTLLFDTWRTTQRSDLLPDVRRLARSLATIDAARATAATDEIVAALNARVDSGWDPADQIRVLRIVGTMEHDDRGDLDRALAAVDRAVALAEEHPEAESTEAAEAACDAAEWLLARRDERARAYLASAAGLRSELDRIATLARIASAELPGVDAGAPASRSARPAVAPILAPLTAPDEPTTAEADAPGRAEDASPSIMDLEAELRRRAEENDLEAMEALARLLEHDPSRARERAGILRALLYSTPHRADQYLALCEAARLSGQRGLAEVAATIASRFDDAIAEPEGAANPAKLSRPLPELLRVGTPAELLEMLRLLSDAVAPMQRRTLVHYGVSGADRVGLLGQRPIAKLFVELRDAFGLTDLVPYVRKDAHAHVSILPTLPVALLVDAALDEDPEYLRYEYARALAVMPTDLAYVTAFDDLQGSGMTAAMVAAFGPPAMLGRITKDAAALAAELWHVVPQKLQAALREAVAKQPAYFQWPQLVAAVEIIGARGVLLSSSLPRALDVLVRRDEAVAANGLSTPEAFGKSVEASPRLTALLRAALENAYLSSR